MFVILCVELTTQTDIDMTLYRYVGSGAAEDAHSSMRETFGDWTELSRDCRKNRVVTDSQSQITLLYVIAIIESAAY